MNVHSNASSFAGIPGLQVNIVTRNADNLCRNTGRQPCLRYYGNFYLVESQNRLELMDLVSKCPGVGQEDRWQLTRFSMARKRSQCSLGLVTLSSLRSSLRIYFTIVGNPSGDGILRIGAPPVTSPGGPHGRDIQATQCTP